MYSSVAAVAFVAIGIGHIHGAVTGDFKVKMMTFAGECATETKGSPDAFAKAWNENALPESKTDKCFLACMMKKCGMLADGKFIVESMNALNRQRWSDERDIEIVDKVNADCVAEVGPAEKDECLMAPKMLDCMFQKSEKAGVTAPAQKDF